MQQSNCALVVHLCTSPRIRPQGGRSRWRPGVRRRDVRTAPTVPAAAPESCRRSIPGRDLERPAATRPVPRPVTTGPWRSPADPAACTETVTRLVGGGHDEVECSEVR